MNPHLLEAASGAAMEEDDEAVVASHFASVRKWATRAATMSHYTRSIYASPEGDDTFASFLVSPSSSVFFFFSVFSSPFCGCMFLSMPPLFVLKNRGHYCLILVLPLFYDHAVPRFLYLRFFSILEKFQVPKYLSP